MSHSNIHIKNLEVEFRKPNTGERFLALNNINLEINAGSFVTIIGSSGCGKSTLLHAVAGLIRPTSGQIRIADRAIDGPGSDRAMIFQDASLLPWRTVHGNVRLGLELQKFSDGNESANARASRFMNMVGLGAFSEYYPHQLSGGMRQRANIARALAVDPEVLLMDEPFGALDAQTRDILAEELLRIWERDKKTALFVTHSIDEAILLADKVVVMGRNPGRIKKIIHVDLVRPRMPDIVDSPEFIEHRKELRALLAEDLQALQLVGGIV